MESMLWWCWCYFRSPSRGAAVPAGFHLSPGAHVWAQVCSQVCVVWAFDRSGFEEGRKLFQKVFVQSEGVAAMRLNRRRAALQQRLSTDR